MPLSVLDGGEVMLLVARFSSSPPFSLFLEGRVHVLFAPNSEVVDNLVQKTDLHIHGLPAVWFRCPFLQHS